MITKLITLLTLIIITQKINSLTIKISANAIVPNNNNIFTNLPSALDKITNSDSIVLIYFND